MNTVTIKLKENGNLTITFGVDVSNDRRLQQIQLAFEPNVNINYNQITYNNFNPPTFMPPDTWSATTQYMDVGKASESGYLSNYLTIGNIINIEGEVTIGNVTENNGFLPRLDVGSLYFQVVLSEVTGGRTHTYAVNNNNNILIIENEIEASFLMLNQYVNRVAKSIVSLTTVTTDKVYLRNEMTDNEQQDYFGANSSEQTRAYYIATRGLGNANYYGSYSESLEMVIIDDSLANLEAEQQEYFGANSSEQTVHIILLQEELVMRITI